MWLAWKYLCQLQMWICPTNYIDGLVQDWCNSIATAQELLQACTKPSIYWFVSMGNTVFITTILIFIIMWILANAIKTI